MCTAISFNAREHYFGRNLDLDISYGEDICVMPRKYPLNFRKMPTILRHYALIGVATVVDGEPLFYDATNEFGLSMAGLNFPNNAYYAPTVEGKDNIAPFEFIPWILGKCKNIGEVLLLLKSINLADIAFSETLPLSPLHWLISDKSKSITVEPMNEGLKIYENSVGILTNNPPFKYHLTNLNNYGNLSIRGVQNGFSGKIEMENYCQGLGAVGLPGDVSSPSRFVRAAFNKLNSVCADTEDGAVTQFFHILSSVEMIEGCCLTTSQKYDRTIYSSCVNTDRGLYYYTTYSSRQINCVDMRRENLDGDKIFRFPLITENKINYQN